MEIKIKKRAIIIIIIVVLGLVMIRTLLIRKYGVVEVEVVRPFIDNMIVTIKCPGSITSKKVHTITAPISGEVAEMSEALITGKKVKKGERLCLVVPREEDLSSAKEELKFAEFSLMSARQDYEVSKQLYALKAISEQELKTKEINLLKEESNVQKIKDKMEPKVIEAPYDGVIVKIEVKNGQAVTSGKDMFVIADMNVLVASLEVLEADINKVELGQKVIIYGEGIPQLNGKIENISMVREETTPGELPKYKVQAGIKYTKNLQLRLGGSITGEIILQQKNAVLQLPLEAVLYELSTPVKPYIFVISKGKAYKRYVEVGVNNGKFIEILSGVDSAEYVVTTGNVMLRDGQNVKITAKRNIPNET
ncbi:MAG: efflux RND transporter periplasmic adaptor subunit [Endomicrobia bacterium]|nr:efflux RND transporter periplasmic adaptor subunit [Endomicrobiia bacterium]